MTTAHGTATTKSAADTSTPSLSELLEPVADDLVVVEQWLNTNLVDDTPFVGELLAQIFQAGGKRIRPAITLLASRATLKEGSDFSRLHIILAVLTELIHTASLVHDDVIDRASLRRGRETINKKWNDRLAVLLGDLLFAQASICLARIMNPVIVGIYGQVLGDLCAGEIRQMRGQFSTVVDWDAYIRKSVSKTASLFSAGSHSGAILNGNGDDRVLALKDYGLNLGICFQIVDDLLDVTGSSSALGKEPGSDLRGGILTAPALFVLERGNEGAREFKELIETRAVQTDDGLTRALEIISTEGGIDSTKAMAADYARKATDSLLKIPPSRFRDSMEALVQHMLTRSK